MSSLVEIGPLVVKKNLYFYKISLLYFPFEPTVTLHLDDKFGSPLPNQVLWEVWLKVAQWFWRRFLHFVNVFFFALFPSKSQLGNRHGSFVCMSLINPLHPRMPLLELAQWFWGRRFFNVLNLLFSLRVWPFILTNLNPLHPRMLFSKFGWNWLGGSGVVL